MTHFPAALHYPQTTFINTDLVLIGHRDLQDFAQQLEAFGLSVLGTHQTEDGLWKASLELDHASGEANFEAVTGGILRCIETLPEPMLKRWHSLQCRTLDLGFEAGTETRHYSRQIDIDLLQRMVALDLELVMTIYAPVSEPLSLAAI